MVRGSKFLAIAGCAGLGLLCFGPVQAQKYPGETIPVAPPVAPRAPAPRPMTPAPYTPPAYVPPPVAPAYTPPRPMAPVAPPVAARPAPIDPASPEGDAQARQLADRLPIDPATRDLRGRLPADVPGTMRRLGLRVPNGTTTDMRGRTPTRAEIINALVH